MGRGSRVEGRGRFKGAEANGRSERTRLAINQQRVQAQHIKRKAVEVRASSVMNQKRGAARRQTQPMSVCRKGKLLYLSMAIGINADRTSLPARPGKRDNIWETVR